MLFLRLTEASNAPQCGPVIGEPLVLAEEVRWASSGTVDLANVPTGRGLRLELALRDEMMHLLGAVCTDVPALHEGEVRDAAILVPEQRLDLAGTFLVEHEVRLVASDADARAEVRAECTTSLGLPTAACDAVDAGIALLGRLETLQRLGFAGDLDKPVANMAWLTAAGVVAESEGALGTGFVAWQADGLRSLDLMHYRFEPNREALATLALDIIGAPLSAAESRDATALLVSRMESTVTSEVGYAETTDANEDFTADTLFGQLYVIPAAGDPYIVPWLALREHL